MLSPSGVMYNLLASFYFIYLFIYLFYGGGGGGWGGANMTRNCHRKLRCVTASGGVLMN